VIVRIHQEVFLSKEFVLILMLFVGLEVVVGILYVSLGVLFLYFPLRLINIENGAVLILVSTFTEVSLQVDWTISHLTVGSLIENN